MQNKGLAAILALAAALPAAAQVEPVQLEIEPGAGTVGSILTVKVHLMAAHPVVGFSLPIAYDPAILTPVSSAPWSPGPLWDGAQSFEATNQVEICPEEVVDSGGGNVLTYPAVSCVRYELADTSGGSLIGPGILAQVSFTITGSGSCFLKGGYHNYVDYRPFIVLIDFNNDSNLVETNVLTAPAPFRLLTVQAASSAGLGAVVTITSHVSNTTSTPSGASFVYRVAGNQVGTSSTSVPVGESDVLWPWDTAGLPAGLYEITVEVQGQPLTMLSTGTITLAEQGAPVVEAGGGGGGGGCRAGGGAGTWSPLALALGLLALRRLLT